MCIAVFIRRKLRDNKDAIIGGIIWTTLMFLIVFAACSCTRVPEEPLDLEAVHCKWHAEFTEWCGECREERFLKTGKRVYKTSKH